MTPRVPLAQVGCGGMGLRHVLGLAQAQRCGIDGFDLIAVCDQHEAAARHVANEAERVLGRRPKVFRDFGAMLNAEQSIQAVNIVTDTRMHHLQALQAMTAGKHVAVEKPMALTVRTCRAMVDQCRRQALVLAVSHNFRRDPAIRLAKAAIDAGLIGRPRISLLVSMMGTRSILQRAAWRHLKLRGGWILESAVHDADLTMFLMGEVERVTAETDIHEKRRFTGAPQLATASRLAQIDEFYRHRVSEAIDETTMIEATAEDTALALLRFRSGAVGQTSFSIAAHGQPTSLQIIHGSEGSITVPANRTGALPRFTPAGHQASVTDAELFSLLPNFEFDETTARVFGRAKGEAPNAPFPEIDQKLIAIEMADFSDAIVRQRDPEVTGEVGLAAVALVYAILESGHGRMPVSMDDVIRGSVCAYQREIDASVVSLTPKVRVKHGKNQL